MRTNLRSSSQLKTHNCTSKVVGGFIKPSSGVLTGFRVLSSEVVGDTMLTLKGNIYSGKVISLDQITINTSPADKYLVYNTSSEVEVKLQLDEGDILLCTFGYVYNPYTPERNGQVEGLPSNWSEIGLSKPSYLWHPVPIDNPEAKVAHDNFHSNNTGYNLPNSGLSGCQVAKEDLTKEPLSGSGTASSRFFLDSDQNFERIFFDGVRVEVRDGISNSTLKDCIMEAHNLQHYFLIRPQLGDNNSESSNVTFENITLSFFEDDQSSVPTNNADLVKPPQGTTFVNIKAFNTPNDPFKLDKGVTYDGFEAYNLGYLEGSHCDGFQATGSSDRYQEQIEIRNGTIWMPAPESINGDLTILGDVNACVYLDPDYGPVEEGVSIRDVLVENCFFNGGIHTLYLVNETTQGYKVRDVIIRNVMMGLDFSRSFASDIAASSIEGSETKAGAGISEWSNVRRIDNGELLDKPSVSRPAIKY